MNPDCRDGKHRACAGDAWDVANDIPTRCACICHAPRHQNSYNPIRTTK